LIKNRSHNRERFFLYFRKRLTDYRAGNYPPTFESNTNTNMNFSVTILGNNSATPVSGRHPTAHAIHHLNRYFLADCGEGTQMQFKRHKVRFSKINDIFISHLHGDHYFGLIGLVTTFHLFGRENELHIYSPPGLEEIINLQLQASQTELAYPLFFHLVDTENATRVYEDEYLEVSTIPMNHRIPTCGYLFREKVRDRNLREGVVKKYKIPSDLISGIKKGNDFIDKHGNVLTVDDLTLDPKPPRSYAFCSDTGYIESTADIVKGVDLLYHEATFMHDRQEMAQEKFHSTSIEAATLAKNAGVKKLIIGHYSARYDDLEPMLEEARTIFPETYLADEGRKFMID
jgi:ribonuclease Z